MAVSDKCFVWLRVNQVHIETLPGASASITASLRSCQVASLFFSSLLSFPFACPQPLTVVPRQYPAHLICSHYRDGSGSHLFPCRHPWAVYIQHALGSPASLKATYLFITDLPRKLLSWHTPYFRWEEKVARLSRKGGGWGTMLAWIRGSPAVTASLAKAEWVNERVKNRPFSFISPLGLITPPPITHTVTHSLPYTPSLSLRVLYPSSHSCFTFITHVTFSTPSSFYLPLPAFSPLATPPPHVSLSRFPSSVRIIEASPPSLSSLFAASGQSAAREARLRGGRMDRERERESGRGEGGEGERRWKETLSWATWRNNAELDTEWWPRCGETQQTGNKRHPHTQRGARGCSGFG